MRRALVTLSAVAAVLLAAVPAVAITYGQPDGNRHPEVGALIATQANPSYPYCSGTLGSSTVFLTAAHCGDEAQRVAVTFDPEPDPSSLLQTGTFHANPAYGSHPQASDVAVVVFDKPVKGISPASLPKAHLLDEMKADGTLNQSTEFTAVGYGSQEVTNGPGGQRLTYEDIREFTVSGFDALGKTYLRLTQNPALGYGGTCYGDSGGPNFLGAGPAETDVIAGLTTTGDRFCKSTNTTTRVDTDQARNFLGEYVTLP